MVCRFVSLCIVALVAPGRSDVCQSDVDVVFILDRSVSIGKDNWNDYVLDFLEAQVRTLAPSAETRTRAGVVLFPVFDGSQDDLSGGAAPAINLTSNLSLILDAIDAAPRGANASSSEGGVCPNSGADMDGACECDPSGYYGEAYGMAPANSSLSWPCGGWRWTPTWDAGQEKGDSMSL